MRKTVRNRGSRTRRAAAIAALILALLPAGAVAGTTGYGPESLPEAHPEREAGVKVTGVERDTHLGRAWLLAELPEEGHLRTASARVKAFAPPEDYVAGFVRIPLIPKLRFARELRRHSAVLVKVTIYFRPTGTRRSQELQKTVTLLRRGLARPTHPHH